MLSPETIKEGTVLMCSLLKFEHLHTNIYKKSQAFHEITSGYDLVSVTNACFHTDWNWLHEVIDEIHESYAEVHIGPGVVKIIDNGYNEELLHFESQPIEAAFKAITDYLRWLETDAVPITNPIQDFPFVEDTLPF